MEKIEYGDSLATQAYEILLQYIFAHKLPAGTRLIDSQLAQELGISRTPVREAIRHLVEDGLVEVRNVRSYYVACPTEKNMHDIYELRQILDEAVVRKLIQAVLPHNPEAYSVLSDLRQRTLEQADFSGATFCKEDEYFHDQITALVQNQVLTQCYSRGILFDSLPTDQQFPLIRAVGTGEYLHKRGLTCAIFANQNMYFPRL